MSSLIAAAIKAPPANSSRITPDMMMLSSRCACMRNDPPTASAVPKMRVNGRGEDVIFFDGVFFKSSLKSIFFVS